MLTQLITPEEVAEAWHITKGTVIKLASDFYGPLAGIAFWSYWRFEESDLNEYATGRPAHYKKQYKPIDIASIIRNRQQKQGQSKNNTFILPVKSYLPLKQLLTTEEVAEAFSLAPSMIKKLFWEGDLPAMKIGKDWRFNEDDLNDYLQKRKIRPVVREPWVPIPAVQPSAPKGRSYPRWLRRFD